MDERDRHSEGMKLRRTVLGSAHVAAAEARKDSFTEPFQDLITRYAWGEVWARPGLSHGALQSAVCRGRVRSRRPRDLKRPVVPLDDKITADRVVRRED